ncbi:neural cell adhesion molecule L1.1-like isoform X1 [Clarias magur]|uniref:Neural cell adhesion molecule L1 n=1 Tax=Clarias magur TaxID=1594786 RepID=A0A8J4TSH0_CLAMG|nr:neural cell adhesion molecule L1.1-like isoform X1 [Clarias magur]
MSRMKCHSSATRGKSRRAQLLFLLVWFGKTFGSIEIPKQYNISDLKEPPLITLQSQSYTAFYIDDVSLRCEASGNPKPTFRWEKDGKQFMNETDDSGIFTADEDDELKNYQGTYRCYAKNDLGTAVSGLIHVITEPIPVSVKEKKVVKIAKEGDSMVLHCNIPESSVNPHIHWMDRKLMHIKQSERITIGLNGNLYFANVLTSNTREDYTCYTQFSEARTILSTDPISLAVHPSNEVVNRKPELHQPKGKHTEYIALRGQTLILECIPHGWPTPSVKWERKDAPLSSSQATKERFDRWLEFESILESDDGEYTCTASNIIGEVTHSYTITVEAAPHWKRKPESARYSPGETVRLDCDADGIPTPHIHWMINGTPINALDPEPRRSVHGGTLILTDVTVTDTAVYQCEASNKHGTALLNTYIHVVDLPPQILTNDGQVYRLIEGSTLLLDCSAFGSPRPQISWEKTGFSELLSDPRVSQMTNGTLLITDVSHEDAGTYLCRATNKMRNTSVSITALLVVLNKTRIVTPLSNHHMERGSSLFWLCSYEVDTRLPKPLIQWRRNGQKITMSSTDDKYTVFENGLLRIVDIHVTDGGNYTCEVITRLDVDTSTGTLTVMDKPDPPVSLKLNEEASRSVTLSWSPGNDNNSPVSEFVIEMREDLPTETGNWKELKRVPAEIHHLEISLLPFCTYHFKVAAINKVGASEFSKPSESYTTPAAAPDITPVKVRTESTDPGSMIITWEELEPKHFNGPDFGYKVFWRDASDPEMPWQSANVSRPPFVVNKTGTFAPFEIKVQAFNEEGEGPSPEAAIGYSGEDIPLEAPTEIEIKQLNATTVSVTWEAVSRESVRGHLRGYVMFVKRLGSREDHVHQRKEKRELATVREMVQDMELVTENEEERRVLIDKEEAVVSGLEFYSHYELSITAYNSKGEGPRSSPTSFITLEGAPGHPSDLRADSPSETELTLSWKKPHKRNGVLKGYILMYQEFVENSPSTLQRVELDDPTATQYNVDKLDAKNYYIFSLKAFTDAGEGEAIQINATTLLDGVPPRSVNATVGETSVNLSWVPGERQRNVEFTVHYLSNGHWEESEQANLTQMFYQLQGLKAGTQYRIEFRHNNVTYWTQQMQTIPSAVVVVRSSFATKGWFIGLISAVVLLLLLLLILCFVKKRKGGKYSVKDKEEGQIDSDVKPMKDEAFGEYSSDNDEKRSFSQRSLCPDLKRESDDSLVEYGDSVDIQFNEDGSFIGQYSGRRDAQPYAHGDHESSGVPSPTNPNTHPPPSGSIPNSITGILGGN